MIFMKRHGMVKLVEWKNSPVRKPLIIRGARQVGKTWLMKEFGRIHFKQTVYLNFEKNNRLQTLFKNDFDLSRVIIALQAESGLSIDPDTTLIVFDEIQAVPEAITALKYFYEDAPGYHIVAAGSLLGVAFQATISFPVGKVEFLDLFPLSFTEFLEANDESALVGMLNSRDWVLISAFKTKFIEFLKYYYFVGGMPECVMTFLHERNFTEVRKIQFQLLEAYEQDFSKHAPLELVPRLRMVWNSIPAQLSKESRKFVYRLVKKGSRAKDFEMAISWLTDCGQATKVFRVNQPKLPLKAYEDVNAFKLFFVDIGLLSAMGSLDAKSILEGNRIFSEFKGALTEQYVLQQMICGDDMVIRYWSSERSTAEVDFVIQMNGMIVPVEVKAEENLQSKSLKVYREKFNPTLSIRTSMSNFREQEWMVNVPLYAISELGALLKDAALTV